MSRLMIEGGIPLCGVLNVQGAKNSVLPILAATLLCDKGESVVENCPYISDTDTAVEIIREMGPSVRRSERTVTVNAESFSRSEIPEALMRKMRSSIVFLGAMLGRCGTATVSFPGGCELGSRPIDLHLSALKQMGVSVTEEYGFLKCRAEKLCGAEINLSFPSVGATENIILAAVKATGTTVINNAAREPEIEDLQNFLNAAGAKISGAGSTTVTVTGVRSLHGVCHRVIPDRIVAATYMCAVAATGGNALIKDVIPAHIRSSVALLREAGCNVKIYGDCLYIECDSKRSPGTVRTMPFPGFPTDLQAPLMAFASGSNGNTVFIETVFDNRYKHVPELIRLGARIKTEGRVAVVEGVKHLKGASVEALDLRGGAALVVAGLMAEGKTVVDNIFHIDRGYEKIENALGELGARIIRIN